MWGIPAITDAAQMSKQQNTLIFKFIRARDTIPDAVDMYINTLKVPHQLKHYSF